ncbi:ribonuclease [Ruminococcaceae bacterium YRB3002]|nr:ribonuclease [Ruminococcaceae bacterium YRB3002]
MRTRIRKIIAILSVITLLAGLAGCDLYTSYQTKSSEETKTVTRVTEVTEGTTETEDLIIDENGAYTHRDDVALYLHTYGHLPYNFITKKEARQLGWNSGGLDRYLEGGCIGGGKFGNYQELLPVADGRQYYECDIDTMHLKDRGSKRIVYSNDGLIYYTEDHYNSFVLLYGDPGDR